MKGIICKVGGRLKHGTFIVEFKKGRLYPIVKLKKMGDGGWKIMKKGKGLLLIGDM